MEEYKVPENKNKFVDSLGNKHDTKQVDAKSLEASKLNVSNLIEDINSLPKPLHVVGPVSKPSVRKAKPEENQLHTGPGKEIK